MPPGPVTATLTWPRHGVAGLGSLKSIRKEVRFVAEAGVQVCCSVPAAVVTGAQGRPMSVLVMVWPAR